jgi:hypothetical protein
VARPEPFVDAASSFVATKNDGAGYPAQTNDAAAAAPAAKKDTTKAKKKKREDYLGKLSADQKRELAQQVYDAMITRGFTRPEGYLLMDVHVMIFRGMIDEDCQGRVALNRLSTLLRTRSDLFQIFNIGVEVANGDTDAHIWCPSRGGEKMVRILLPGSEKPEEASLPAA